MNNHDGSKSPRSLEVELYKVLNSEESDGVIESLELIKSLCERKFESNTGINLKESKEIYIYCILYIIIDKIKILNVGIILDILSHISSEMVKYKIINLLRSHFPILTIGEIVRISDNFKNERFRYKVSSKLLNNSFYLIEDNSLLIRSFVIEKYKNKITRDLSHLRKGLNYSNVITSIAKYPFGKLKALENSITCSHLKLGDTSEYCSELRQIFNCTDYVKACDILGIDPEVSNLFL